PPPPPLPPPAPSIWFPDPTKSFFPQVGNQKFSVFSIRRSRERDFQRFWVIRGIKQQSGRAAGTDRDWLRKVGPWFQHSAHMQVRLRCPADSLECEDQPLPPPGD
ncbi:penicillin-insensitive murein endopeptidase, partial [Escherichia coli]|uniref:penicillin-insensitive murein endopeptidase n=1 Tax=Escherichia coli TaxID=562 RepID=UPI0014856C3D